MAGNYLLFRAFQVELVVKNPPANAGRRKRQCLRVPGGGHGNSLPCSCLEKRMDRGAWWATIYRAKKSRTQLKGLSTHAHAPGGVPPGLMEMEPRSETMRSPYWDGPQRARGLTSTSKRSLS